MTEITYVPKPQYARAKRAAEHFQISVSSLWAWTKSRKDFPQPLKAGERVTLFDLGAIDSYLKNERGAR